MSHYRHLSIEEREKRYLMAERGETLRQIAKELNRAVSTISRELKRNKAAKHPYSPSKAQRSYEKRRKLCGRKHILSCPEKREYIRHLIQDLHWSPEEIANRLKLESAALQLSYGSIYRAIDAGLFDANKREASRCRKFCLVSDAQIDELIALLNLRPRKCLNWRSPVEVFFSSLLHLT